MDFDDLKSHGTLQGDLDAELDDVAEVSCPYCGESSELSVDPGGGATQEYVEDCPVCCRANVIYVELDHAGEARVWARAE